MKITEVSPCLAWHIIRTDGRLLNADIINSGPGFASKVFAGQTLRVEKIASAVGNLGQETPGLYAAERIIDALNHVYRRASAGTICRVSLTGTVKMFQHVEADIPGRCELIAQERTVLWMYDWQPLD